MQSFFKFEVAAFQRAYLDRRTSPEKLAQQDSMVLAAEESYELIQSTNYGIAVEDWSDREPWVSVADGVSTSPRAALASSSFLSLLHQLDTGGSGLSEQVHESTELPALVHAAYQRWQMQYLRRSTRGASTTLASLQIRGNTVCVVNCGDSRVWRIRKGGDGTSQIEQLSRDHTLWQEMLDSGEVDSHQCGASVYQALTHCLTLGDGDDLLEPDEEDAPASSQFSLRVWRGTIRAGDIYLLATDGLHGMSEDFDLGRQWQSSKTLEGNLEGLLRAWRAHEGNDDISVIAISCRENTD